MSDFHSRMNSIIALLQGEISSVNLLVATKKCTALRSDFPNVSAAYDVSAYCSCHVGNFEAAQFFLSEVVRLSPGSSASLDNLDIVLKQNNSIYKSEDYMKKISKGKDQYIEEIFQKSNKCFKSKKYQESDALIQQGCALKNPETSPLPTLSESHEFTQTFETEDAFENETEKLENSFQNLWLNTADADVNLIDEMLSSTPDRQWTTKVIIDFIKGIKIASPQILELGCYTGYNLANISKASKNENFKPSLTGIEPYKPAIEYGISKYPEITFHKGTYQDWIHGEIQTPEYFDIILLNRLLQIFKPENVKKILDHAKQHCRYLIIVDDIMNWEGTQVLLRENFIMLYPFKKYLEEHGFEILNLIPAEAPDRAFTGCIIARNTRI